MCSGGKGKCANGRHGLHYYNHNAHLQMASIAGMRHYIKLISMGQPVGCCGRKRKCVGKMVEALFLRCTSHLQEQWSGHWGPLRYGALFIRLA